MASQVVVSDGCGGMEGFALGHLEELLSTALATLRGAGVVVKGDCVDHVCYRSATAAEYELVCCQAAEGGGTLLLESMIGGRPISIYRLEKPLAVAGQSISLLELPAPKAGRAYASGWEHAEIAVGGRLEALAERLRSEDLGLDVSWKAWQKKVNKDVSVGCPSGTFSVKFHELALDEVVRLELRDGLVEAVPDDYWDRPMHAAAASAAAHKAMYVEHQNGLRSEAPAAGPLDPFEAALKNGSLNIVPLREPCDLCFADMDEDSLADAVDEIEEKEDVGTLVAALQHCCDQEWDCPAEACADALNRLAARPVPDAAAAAAAVARALDVFNRVFKEEPSLCEVLLSCGRRLAPSAPAVLADAAAAIAAVLDEHDDGEATLQEQGCLLVEALALASKPAARQLDDAGLRAAVDRARDHITNERNKTYPDRALAALDAAAAPEA